MILWCRHKGCKTTLERDVTHLAFLRLAAQKIGWGYTFQIHPITFETRAFDYCPEHKGDVDRPETRR